MLHPKQSFSKRLNQSVRNYSLTHPPESPLLSAQNILASSKYMFNMKQKGSSENLIEVKMALKINLPINWFYR